MEALLSEHAQGDIQELLAAPGRRQTGRMGTYRHPTQRTRRGEQESDPPLGNTYVVRPPKQTPSTTGRRPPEPFRPLPARKLGVSLLSVQARRRRYKTILPPKAGEAGGW